MDLPAGKNKVNFKSKNVKITGDLFLPNKQIQMSNTRININGVMPLDLDKINLKVNKA